MVRNWNRFEVLEYGGHHGIIRYNGDVSALRCICVYCPDVAIQDCLVIGALLHHIQLRAWQRWGFQLVFITTRVATVVAPNLCHILN